MKTKILACLFVAGIFSLQHAAAQNFVIIEDFEDPDGVTIPLNDMTGGEAVAEDDVYQVIDNPDQSDVNSSDQVLQFTRAHDGVPWAGFWSEPWEALNMNEMKYTHYQVWKPRISEVRFKVEGSEETDDFELPSMEEQTKTEEWENMTFHYPDAAGEYPVIAVMPDFADPVDLDENIVIYLDNIILSDSEEFPVLTSAESDEVPVQMALRQNYPNPFNPTTNITFELNSSQHVELNVYNIQGQHMATLVDGVRSAGQHEVNFNAEDLPSGMYLYRMQTPERSITRTMTLIK